MKRSIFLLACFLLTLLSYSQQSESPLKKANEQIAQRGEVYFSFQLQNIEDIKTLTRQISIDKISGNTVYAYANAREFPLLLNYTSDFQVLTPPSQLVQVKTTDDPKQALDWNYYPTYTAYESLMSQFVTDHPSICKLITIGTLASGRKLLAVKITDNPDVQEAEPEFLYTSSIHGDETTGYVLMLHLIDYLLQNYGFDQRITDMINSTEIYINPLSNPDGTYKGGNSTVNGATRGNANNIDLNRNYIDPEDGPHPDGNPWQPETVAFMNFAGFHHFTMSANFHGGSEVLNYPWDTWPRLAADNDWWVMACREYADTVHLHAPSNYMNEFQNGISNGYAWYTISGGRQDYMNYFRNCREVTIEISNTKILPANQLENHWEYNYRSFLNYITEANYGLHGIVTDSITGNPLYARVFINGHDIDSSHVFTDVQVGDYHRLLKAGTYNVTFSSAGHYSKTIPVQITDFQRTNLNVQLYDGSLKTNFGSDIQDVSTGDSVHFSDLSAGNPDSWSWEFEGGLPGVSAEKNPVVTYSNSGTYKVKLVVSRPGVTDSLIRESYIIVKPGYVMGNATYSVCDALFLDSGGSHSGYSPNENTVITFSPSSPNSKIRVSFLSFNVESSSNCSNDKLNVYDGADLSAPLIGTLCGSIPPTAILATNSSGSLTFEFQSNGSVEGEGWTALVECDSNVGVENNAAVEFTLFPNPVTGKYFSIHSGKKTDRLTIHDMTGRLISSQEPATSDFTVPAPEHEGIYIVKIWSETGCSSQRLIVTRKK